MKVGRNDPCLCGSGQKYKFCCIGKSLRTRIVELESVCDHCASPGQVDLTQDLFNHVAAEQIPLKNFCKEHGFYYFAMVSVAEHLELMKGLATGTLTRDEILALFRARTSEEMVLRLIDEASSWCESFARRRSILLDAAKVHFSGMYTVSIPVLFAQLEGLLRDIGGLASSAKFKPTLSTDGWEARLLFMVKDNVEYFNAYISKLFEGQQSAENYGRNSVLHGVNTDYASEDESLLLILSILEVRNTLWLRKNSYSLIRGAKESGLS